jgi:hypothetical protein
VRHTNGKGNREKKREEAGNTKYDTSPDSTRPHPEKFSLQNYLTLPFWPKGASFSKAALAWIKFVI